MPEGFGASEWGTAVHSMSRKLSNTRLAPSEDALAAQFGTFVPLQSNNGRRAPDKRRVSFRWFSGSILTGLTSLLLMGGALWAAMDGREQLALPATILDKLTTRAENTGVTKGGRLVSIVALEPAREKVLLVPTVTRTGESNVIRKKPFAFAAAPLAIVPTRKTKFPAFNPLTVFSESRADSKVASSDVIYSANVEGEVTIQTEPFPLDTALYETGIEISAYEAEITVAKARESLSDGGIQTAALPYLDSTRFELEQAVVQPVGGLGITVVAENVTRVPQNDDADGGGPRYSEEVIVVARPQTLRAVLEGLDGDSQTTIAIADALADKAGSAEVSPGHKLRIAWERSADDGGIELRRASLYRSGEHFGSIALSDENELMEGLEPTAIPATAAADNDEKVITTVSRANLPNAYDGIFRAALSQGLTKDHATRIVRTVAFDVDFRTTISPKDELEVFYSVEDGEEAATDESEILYVGLTLKGVKRRYYRFRTGKKGRVEYFDETGKSAKKFLLRKPVPNARFGSAFGQRRHPISRRWKLHSGVDFSAPRGTPILAAGNGVVEKAGWASGYGKQTIIRHANGYKTSYSHQHRFAKGIREGARVRQGQIIGQVGSTGYSTGPHLHYEVIVNGNKVNPMKIRLPKGTVLSGSELSAFKRERSRIDALLDRSRETDTAVASL